MSDVEISVKKKKEKNPCVRSSALLSEETDVLLSEDRQDKEERLLDMF